MSGRLFYRLPKQCRVGIAVVRFWCSSRWRYPFARPRFPPDIDRLLFRVGGATVVFSLVAVFLLGVVWGVPGRSIRSVYLVLLITVAVSLLIIEVSPHLWWRFCALTAWQRFPDAQGRLQQSSSVTCSPAAAAMSTLLWGSH